MTLYTASCLALLTLTCPTTLAWLVERPTVAWKLPVSPTATTKEWHTVEDPLLLSIDQGQLAKDMVFEQQTLGQQLNRHQFLQWRKTLPDSQHLYQVQATKPVGIDADLLQIDWRVTWLSPPWQLLWTICQHLSSLDLVPSRSPPSRTAGPTRLAIDIGMGQWRIPTKSLRGTSLLRLSRGKVIQWMEWIAKDSTNIETLHEFCHTIRPWPNHPAADLLPPVAAQTQPLNGTVAMLLGGMGLTLVLQALSMMDGDVAVWSAPPTGLLHVRLS